MSTPAITSDLREWIVAQAKAGCALEDLVKSMQVSGWPEAVARAALVETLAARAGDAGAGAAAAAALPAVEVPAQPAAQALPDAVPVPEPDLADARPLLQLPDREVQVLLTMKRPRVVLFGNFLSQEECDGLVALAAPRLARSQTVDQSGGSAVNAARTSDGMFFERGEAPLLQRIEARIAALLRWPANHGEGLQILRYRPGAQYQPHFDFFDPAQPGTAAVLRRGGQRVGTLIMYLNDPERGGATTFPDVGLEVAPVKGHALFFSYDRPHASTGTLHGGAPVTDGEKWVATKWLREDEFG